MAGEARFDGKVVVVTGAGNGLGRSHALAFAGRGARVVVNDLGGGTAGDGASQNAADRVVAEILEAGGEAVANYDSVVDGDKVVATALETWGRVDVVVNNAGILRDKTFHKMSAADWDIIFKVHVEGAFAVTHAAWPHFREQKYGRVIFTSSAAGIYGNFGQTNYGAAKLALVGFANTLALEGHKRNIHVNTIAPLAASRLTEGIIPEAMFDAIQPELVSPLVLWLCHQDCEETGGLFEVGGGMFAKLRWERAAGKVFRIGRPVEVEGVAGHWDAITSFEGSSHPANITASMGPVIDNLEKGPSKGGSKYIDVDQALGYELPPVTTRYDAKDVAIYALGVGAAHQAQDGSELQLVYESHSDGFRVLPTWGVVPVINSILAQAAESHLAPGLSFGLDRLLHGEQYTEVIRPLPAEASLTHKSKVTDIFDKGKGATIVIETSSYDDDGDLLVRNVFTAFIRGAGGWGGDRGPSRKKNVPPERAPDHVTEQRVASNQALLYRLSGDWNPLHVDPSFAKAFGFDKPILHGLCTYGYAARHVIDAFCGGDPRYFKSIAVRFAKTVFPGETLVTEMWKTSPTTVVFRCKVAERDEPVITHAVVQLYEAIPEKKVKEVAPVAEAAAPAVVTAADIFGAIDSYVAQHPELVGSVGKVYQFQLSSPDSAWTLDLASGSGSVTAGQAGKADCTLALSDADFVAMSSGEIDPMKLYMGGQLKISGDLMASQKLDFLQKIERPAPGGAAPAEAASDEPGSLDVFIGMAIYVERHPELVSDVGKVFHFEIQDPESHWTLDLKNGSGSVTQGAPAKPDCTLTLSEDDFNAMTRGEADPMKLYMQGKLSIGGDLMASQKLTFLQEIDPAEVADEVAKRKAAGVQTTVVADEAPAAAPAILAALGERLTAVSGAGTLQLVVSEPEGRWVIDLEGGRVSEGTVAAPSATIEIADEDVAALAGGVEPGDLFQRGRLRVRGDLRLAHHLTALHA